MKTELAIGNFHLNLATRSRRRWLVRAFYAAFAALLAAWFLWGSTGSTPGLALFLFFALGLSFIGGRSSRRGLIPPDEDGDERELLRRYRAHYLVYNWLDMLCIPAFFAAVAVNTPAVHNAGPGAQILVSRLAWTLLMAVGILYYTLPQAILLWTEPDMEAQQ